MKDQIEFHFAVTEDPFVVDPADIRMVYKWMDGAMLQMRYNNGDGGYDELEVVESYETVKRMLSEHKYPHAEDVSPDYVPETPAKKENPMPQGSAYPYG